MHSTEDKLNSRSKTPRQKPDMRLPSLADKQIVFVNFVHLRQKMEMYVGWCAVLCLLVCGVHGNGGYSGNGESKYPYYYYSMKHLNVTIILSAVTGNFSGVLKIPQANFSVRRQGNFSTKR